MESVKIYLFHIATTDHSRLFQESHLGAEVADELSGNLPHIEQPGDLLTRNKDSHLNLVVQTVFDKSPEHCLCSKGRQQRKSDRNWHLHNIKINTYGRGVK